MDLPLTISQAQEELFEKKYSTSELVKGYFDLINKYNEKLNIFLTLSENKALVEAKKADELFKNYNKIDDFKKDFPLFGAALAHKDIFLTKGIKTTAGSKVLSDYIPQYSATVVERLESGGAISLGKVNCDAWAHGSSGENSDFGATKNPWNKDFVSGGSSSGSGASVASGMSIFATATDTCGSTRLPANFCYGVGLKPTYGAVSRHGIVAMASSLDSPGAITRSVSDCELVFNTIRGQDGKDSTVSKGRVDLKNKLTIGIPKEFFGQGLDSEVEKQIAGAIGIFKKDGIEFKEVTLPHTKYAISAYYIIQPAEVSSNLGRYDGIRIGSDRDSFGDEAKRRIMLGTYVLSSGYYDAYYLKAMKVRTVIIKEIDKVFEAVDALIAPVSPTPPFKLGEKVNDPLKMYLTDIFAATANLSGIPALALPFGFSKLGLPLGFQLMGPKFSENLLFSLGKRFEKLSGFMPKVATIT